MSHSACRFAKFALRFVLYGLLILGTACQPATPPAADELIRVQYSFAAQPWLANLNDCAGKNVLAVELRAADFQDPKSADLVIRIGLPDKLATPAYQIGTEDLLVIVNRQNPLKKLTADQVRALFTGRVLNWKPINGTDAPVQVWVFPMSEDVQQILEQSILGGSQVTSTARLANSPDEMLQAISNEADAIGVITRHWKNGSTLDVFVASSSLPVLAITQPKSQGALGQILACLQR